MRIIVTKLARPGGCVKVGLAATRERIKPVAGAGPACDRPVALATAGAAIAREHLRTNAMHRVLLAEDDEAMRAVLARALDDAGYEVLPVADGTQAMAALEEFHFDLLLSDIVMPGIGGIELARHCERAWPETRVMLITGFAAVSVEASRETPRATVLSKPFHLRTLVREVDRLLA